jgi:hypothetical protein
MKNDKNTCLPIPPLESQNEYYQLRDGGGKVALVLGVRGRDNG